MSARFTLELEGEDPLGVLTSTAPVVRDGNWVRIDGAAVEAFARAHAGRPAPSHGEEALHCTFLPPERFCNYLLALEALNFCFWDEAPRWRVAHGGGSHDGYWALAAALHRAVAEEEAPIWDAAFLAQVDEAEVARLLRGEGRPPPLLAERAAHLREVGRVLLERWDGWFANLIRACAGAAPALVARIAAEFSSFDDRTHWRGREVRFFKRAQICAADLARLLPHDPLGSLSGLGALTAFADYKVPQVLRKEGILLPAPALAERIDRCEPLPAGGEEEVEIRAATVWACEWIARALSRITAGETTAGGAGGGGGDSLAGGAVSAAEVDYLLWSAGQDKAGLPPYHRTRTIYY